MAFSTYTELGTLQHLNTQISFQQRQAELAGELLSYSNNFELQNTLLHPLYDQESLLHPEECYTHLLPYLSSSCEPFISLSEMLTPPQDFEPYSFPKRQRCHENQFSLDFTPTFFDGLVPNPCMVTEVLPELFSQLPEYGIPQVDYTQNVESSKKMNERSVSAQSIAARERRRKITEKTQELGRLIPGCSKMNTAEMLQTASKYVKYLQAQVGILELMGSFQVMFMLEIIINFIQFYL